MVMRLRRLRQVPARTACFALLAGLLAPSLARGQDRYEVVPHQIGPRWHLWVSEGANDVLSGNQSYWGNRFRLGGDVQLGDDHRWILGITVLDFISSGEATVSVGGISRAAIDFSAGAFIVPNALYLIYSLHLEDVRGSRISGGVAAVGQEVALGYRFFDHRQISLAAEASYLYVPSVSTSVIDVPTGVPALAVFPSCDVITLALKIGYNFLG